MCVNCMTVCQRHAHEGAVLAAVSPFVSVLFSCTCERNKGRREQERGERAAPAKVSEREREREREREGEREREREEGARGRETRARALFQRCQQCAQNAQAAAAKALVATFLPVAPVLSTRNGSGARETGSLAGSSMTHERAGAPEARAGGTTASHLTTAVALKLQQGGCLRRQCSLCSGSRHSSSGLLQRVRRTLHLFLTSQYACPNGAVVVE